MDEKAFAKETITIEKFQDFRAENLSEKDLRGIPAEILMTAQFDSQTIWPSAEYLPAGFNPKEILEQGKNPGLGLRELHEQGFTGKGIHVAIIDQSLDNFHSEYSAALENNREIGDLNNEDVSLHGPAVASFLVGKNCGVAPESRLHYWSRASGINARWENQVECLNEIIKHNDTATEPEKIRVVSCSTGYPNPHIKGDLKKWPETIARAKNSGITYVDARDISALGFTRGGNFGDKEDVDGYMPSIYMEESNEKGKIISGIIVPSDYRTMASSWNKKDFSGPDEYLYEGRGGISWAIPYLAGIFALMLQIDKKLNREEMAEIIRDTATTNKNGLKVINPKGIIERVTSGVQKAS